VPKSYSTIEEARDRADIRRIEELEKLFHSVDWQAHEERIKDAFRPKQQDVAEQAE
jgi:hypothetical protein